LLKAKIHRMWALPALLVGMQSFAPAQTKPATAAAQEVTFPSGRLELHGFLWMPEGTGPYPAMLWNHGSEKMPGSQPGLAAFYRAHG